MTNCVLWLLRLIYKCWNSPFHSLCDALVGRISTQLPRLYVIISKIPKGESRWQYAVRVTEREGGVRISCGSFFSKKKGISLVSGRVTFRSAKRPKSQGVNTVERKLFLFPPFADVCQALKTGPIFTNDSRIRKCHATHESASKIRRWAPLCRVITITLGIYLNFVFISPGKKRRKKKK